MTLWKRAGLAALLAGALAGCGGTERPAAVVTAAGGAAPPLTKTELIRYLPPPGGAVAREGACWAASIAADRPGAYRCQAGNEILDPCFAAEPAATQVECEPDPIAGLPGVILGLTEPLPSVEASSTAAPHGWLVELADGTVCAPFTGARGAVAGQIIAYGCAPGPDGEGAVLLGDLLPGAPWTASKAILADGEPLAVESRTEAPIRRVWQ